MLASHKCCIKIAYFTEIAEKIYFSKDGISVVLASANAVLNSQTLFQLLLCNKYLIDYLLHCTRNFKWACMYGLASSP